MKESRKRKIKDEPLKSSQGESFPLSPVPGSEDKTELSQEVEKPRVKCLSNFDRDSKLKLSPDFMKVFGEKGYRMIRGTFGVAEGDCYFEVTVEDSISIGPKYPEAHMRIGWSTDKGNVEAPAGFDKYSYSYRDVKGTKFHQSIGQAYGEPYGPKDVIGCFIRLRDDQPESELKDLTPLQIQFREQAKQAAMLPLSGSKIIFFKNGVSQGVAFTDIFKGTYFPAIALYMGASVSVNFGPDFKYPLPEVIGDGLGSFEPGPEIFNPNHIQEEKKLVKTVKIPRSEVPYSPNNASPIKKSRNRKKVVVGNNGHGSGDTLTPIETPDAILIKTEEVTVVMEQPS